MIHYYVQTLPETTGLYFGLVFQAMLRGSALRYLPGILILCNLVALAMYGLRYAAGTRWALVTGIQYLCLSLGILVVFWPEASPFGRVRRLGPEQIASYAAIQDPSATIVTAYDTGETSSAATLETEGFAFMLGWLIDTPLALARAINPEAHQPFRAMLSMHWYLGLDSNLSVETNTAVTDWVEGCYKPALTQDKEFQDAINGRDLLPWGNTPVAQALATRETVPGSSVGGRYLTRKPTPLGALFWSNPGTTNVVRCDMYLTALEQDVGNFLLTTRSPAGRPLSEVFQQDFGWSMQEQARFLLHREMLRAMGRPSPAPSLGGAYATVAGARVATGAAGGALGGAQSGRGGLLGSLFGAGGAVVNQADGLLATFQWWLGIAVWFIYWSPLIFGFAWQILVGFFPITVCYALWSGKQLPTLITYFLFLLYVACAPLWFAYVDLAARAAVSQAPQTQDPLLSLFNWAPAQTHGVVATVKGFVMVFVLGAAMLFQTLRNGLAALRP